MKMNKWTIGLAGILTAGGIAGLTMMNRAQSAPQSLPPGVSQGEHNSHHPEKKPVTTPQKQVVQIDRHFIEMMIPHHQDAVAMADLALTRAKHPEIEKLAQAIQQDHTREIDRMRTWYKQWFGKAVPPTPTMGSMMAGQGMMQGNRGMMNSPTIMGPGTMSMNKMSMNNMQGMHTDLNALKAAKDFDLEFLRQMIPHHRMAIMMAQMLQNGTTRPEMKTLAQSILKTQTTEINQMKQWYLVWNR